MSRSNPVIHNEAPMAKGPQTATLDERSPTGSPHLWIVVWTLQKYLQNSAFSDPWRVLRALRDAAMLAALDSE